jgi:hypothetical protein
MLTRIRLWWEKARRDELTRRVTSMTAAAVQARARVNMQVARLDALLLDPLTTTINGRLCRSGIFYCWGCGRSEGEYLPPVECPECGRNNRTQIKKV